MKLEQQVVSLELAKKLKELGVKQESEFYWTEFFGDRYEIKHKDFASGGQTGNCSAFTVAELGEMLPDGYVAVKQPDGWYHGDYAHDLEDGIFVNTHLGSNADTEADARAKMRIYLLENNLINN